jgi:hypothetical protein
MTAIKLRVAPDRQLMHVCESRSSRLLALGGWATVLLCSTTQVGLAHHSFAPHFDSSRPIVISGTVTEFEARNPHAYLHIEARDEAGQIHEYVCESHGVTQLERNGIDPALLAPGTHVRVEGARARRDEYMCFFQTIQIGGGPVLSVNGPRGGRSPAAVPAGGQAGDRSGKSGILGTWLLVPANRSTSGPNPMMSFLTPAGGQAVSSYDPYVDDPTFRCSPVGIRRVWFAPGTPLAISLDGDRVILRHEWMDVVRIVHLDETEHPADGPRTTLGHSIGRFEDGRLIIETANFAAGVLRQYVEQPDGSMKGLLHSEALTTTEVLRYDPDSGTLEITIDMQDPVYFTRDFPTATAQYAPTDLEITPFGCIPEVVD